MPPTFTVRQGQYLAFIQGFITRRGYAPSFDELGAHFGTTPPTVNSMIKMLERKGLLSRVAGAARSLRVLVPADQLPGSEYGARAPLAGRRGSERPSTHAAGQGELAAAAAIAVLEVLLPLLLARTAISRQSTASPRVALPHKLRIRLRTAASRTWTQSHQTHRFASHLVRRWCGSESRSWALMSAC